ncbi:hypothetical protein C9374_005280 [Naegleria lovaniensis]|uniref:Protein kinase domain-containing protein n=1 Tax=Naegleria lovaniensis TaxID=51637 RepID=A0AA88KKK1_NAELO|nr:uncharacterized protein C9374_005280 [Naegleria lovaniensis]KAG2382700.1 hypothetical protein C9374_005280 [Naegleria lovaniensis]
MPQKKRKDPPPKEEPKNNTILKKQHFSTIHNKTDSEAHEENKPTQNENFPVKKKSKRERFDLKEVPQTVLQNKIFLKDEDVSKNHSAQCIKLVLIGEEIYSFIPDEKFDAISRNDKKIQSGIIQLGTNMVCPVVLKKSSSEENWNTHYASKVMRTLYVETRGDLISLKGIPLHEQLGKNMALNEVKRMVCHILCQISFLEKQGFVHNDVKPENIVKYDEHYFQIDFEISKRFDYNKEEYQASKGKCTLDGVPLTSRSHSPGYRAPEREQHHLISPKSDMYSLGLVILKCFGLSFEKIHETKDRTIEHDIKHELKRICGTDSIFYEVVLNLLEYDPEKRTLPDGLLFLFTDAKTVVNYFFEANAFKKKYFPPKPFQQVCPQELF